MSDVNDNACCSSLTDCVYNDYCFFDINAAIAGVQEENAAFCSGKPTQSSCTSGVIKGKCLWFPDLSPPKFGACVAAATREAVFISQTKGGGTVYQAYADVNGDGSFEVCHAASPGKWESAFGIENGTVTNLTGPVGGALVRVLGTPFSAVTDVNGYYFINNVPAGNHDVTAAKTGYDSSTAYNVSVPDNGTVTADFVLTHSLGSCEDDCTTVGSNRCDASCHGKGLCWFYSDVTKAACDGTFGIVELPGGQSVNCCVGQPYSPIKAAISVPSKNVVTIRKPVLYNGRLLNLVFVVFNRQ